MKKTMMAAWAAGLGLLGPWSLGCAAETPPESTSQRASLQFQLSATRHHPLASRVRDASDASVSGDVVLEEEHGDLISPQYLNFPPVDGVVRWSGIDIAAEGIYQLRIRYALGSSSGANRTIALSVDDGPAQSVTFAHTGDWASWVEHALDVELSQGEHDIELRSTGQDGPNVARILLAPVTLAGEDSGLLVGTPVTSLPATDAELIGGTTLDEEHGDAISPVYANLPPEDGAVRWTAEVPSPGLYALRFRYSVGDVPRTVELVVDSAANQINFPATGVWTSWAKRVAEVELTAGEHTFELRVIGDNGPNVGSLEIAAISLRGEQRNLQEPGGGPAIAPLPATLSVSVGATGTDGAAQLRFEGPEGSTFCDYAGSAGTSLSLQGCVDAEGEARAGWVGGANVEITSAILEVLRGDPALPMDAPRTTVVANFGGTECRGLTAFDGIHFRASDETREAHDIGSWRMELMVDGESFSYQFEAYDLEDRESHLGFLSFDRAATNALPEEPTKEAFDAAYEGRFGALRGPELTAEQEDALLEAFFEDLPGPTCLDVALATRPEPDPLAFAGEDPEDDDAGDVGGIASPLRADPDGSNPDGYWDCEAVIDAAIRDALQNNDDLRGPAVQTLVSSKTRTGLILPPEAQERIACCQANPNASATGGKDCSCAAKTGGQRPFRIEDKAWHVDGSVPFYHQWDVYACEACPASEPIWNEDDERCEACPEGESWSVASQQCEAEPEGGGPPPPTWHPNTTGKGLASGCYYRVILEFRRQTLDTSAVYDGSGRLTPDGRAECNDQGWKPYGHPGDNDYGYTSAVTQDGEVCDTWALSSQDKCSCGETDCHGREHFRRFGSCDTSGYENLSSAQCVQDDYIGSASLFRYAAIVPGPISGAGMLSRVPAYAPCGPDELPYQCFENSAIIGAGGSMREISIDRTFEYHLFDQNLNKHRALRERDVPCFEFVDVRIADIEPYEGGIWPMPRSTWQSSFPSHPNRRATTLLLRELSTCSDPMEPGGPPPIEPRPTDTAPACPAPRVRAADGRCTCPPDGPPAFGEGECACPPGEEWDEELGQCVDDGLRYCDGAIGSGCTFVQDTLGESIASCPRGSRGIPNRACITDIHARGLEGGLQYQGTSVGSMLHDQCCNDHPKDGFRCGNNDVPGTVCFDEFMRAARDLTSGNYWPVLYDTALGTDPEVTRVVDEAESPTLYGSQVLAPYGVRMSSEDALYCQSGAIVQAASGESICGPILDEEPGTVAPVAATAVAGTGGSSGGGSCERFQGESEELELFVTRHQDYLREVSSALGDTIYSMDWYFTYSPGDEVWVWRDARGEIRSATLLDESNTDFDYAIQSGTHMEALASAARGAGPALLDCLLGELATEQRLPLYAQASAQATQWWERQAVRRNQIEPGTVAYESADAAWVFFSPHELDTFVAIASAETQSRNIECIEGTYARYALGATSSGDYRIRISKPASLDQAAMLNVVPLENALTDGGVTVLSTGWISYASWNRYAGPSSTEPSIRMTDDNFCERGRPLQGVEVLSDDSLSPDFAEDSLDVFIDYWLSESDRRQEAGMPELLQSVFDPATEVQQLHGPNAPGPCEGEVIAAPLRELQHEAGFDNWYEQDCFNDYAHFTDPAAMASEWRDTYEVTGTGGLLTWLRDLPGAWSAGSEVTLGEEVSQDDNESYPPLWVLSPDNRLFLLPATERRSRSWRSNHAQPMGGGAVLSAGEIVVTNGQLISANNKSGHYRPSCESLDLLVEKLSSLGVDAGADQVSCVP